MGQLLPADYLQAMQKNHAMGFAGVAGRRVRAADSRQRDYTHRQQMLCGEQIFFPTCHSGRLPYRETTLGKEPHEPAPAKHPHRIG